MTVHRRCTYAAALARRRIVADPHVELQDGPVKQDMVAREVTGDEKALWWDRAVTAWPDYSEYQKKTARQIPVFVLDPVDE